MSFLIEPHRGVGPISFGMSRPQVAAALAGCGGAPSRLRGEKTDCFFGASLQASYGDDGRVEFVEVASSLSAGALFAGRDVCDTPADELLAAAEALEAFDPGLSRPPGEYVFPGLIFTLWGRSRQYDHRGGGRRELFAAIGVGSPAYLAAVRRIRRV